jgi:hypothetical protein
MFVEGTIVATLFLAFIWGFQIYYIEKARGGKLPNIRMIPALNAIDEAVGRAAEMGGKVMFVNGIGKLTDVSGPETIAGLSVLRYVCRESGQRGVEVVAPFTQAEVLPVAVEAMKAGYIESGSPEIFQEGDNVRYVSSSQWGLATSCMGIIGRENAVSSILVGAFAGEALAIVSAGAENGVFQIGGCGRNTTQMPWFVSMCEYSLIGEEVYAAGAYLSQNPVELGSLIGQDFGKYLTVFLMIIGFILGILNIDVLYNILGV